MEAAPGGRVDRARHVTAQNDPLLLEAGVRLGHRRQQRLGIGVLRPQEQVGAVADFDDLAEIHHGDAVTDVLDDGDVVRDEQIGEAELLLQIAQEVDDLRLHRDVERRHRLVADDEARIERQGAGDADPLALTAGEFVRVAVQRLGPQADLVGERLDPLVERAAMGDPVIPQRLGDDVADPEARVQGGIGILEDDLQFAAIGPHLAARQLVDALAIDADFAGGRLDQLQNGLAGGRFATAALADQPQRLSRRDVERDAVDGVNLPDGALQEARA